jgi:hypothetical protein
MVQVVMVQVVMVRVVTVRVVTVRVEMDEVAKVRVAMDEVVMEGVIKTVKVDADKGPGSAWFLVAQVWLVGQAGELRNQSNGALACLRGSRSILLNLRMAEYRKSWI